MYRMTRTAAVSLALVAMLLRAFLPAGWMPSAAAGQTLVICTLQGPVRIDLPSHKPAVLQHHAQTCPFAVAPQLAGPLAEVALLPPAFRIGATEGIVIATAPSGDKQHSSSSPRAPPFFA